MPLRVTRPWPDPTFLVDSIRAADQVRRVYTRLIQVDANPNGTAASAVFIPPRPMPDTALTRMLQRRIVLAGGAGVVFEEQILASIFQMPSGQLRAGARWSEPWNWQIERNGVSAGERGTRVTTVLRDTLIGGRTRLKCGPAPSFDSPLPRSVANLRSSRLDARSILPSFNNGRTRTFSTT